MDSYAGYILGQFFFNGHNPYVDYQLEEYQFLTEFRFLPPLIYYELYIFNFLTARNLNAMGYFLKIVFNLAEFASMWVLYLFAKEFLSETKSKLVVLLYGLSPASSFVMGFIGLKWNQREKRTSYFMITWQEKF